MRCSYALRFPHLAGVMTSPIPAPQPESITEVLNRVANGSEGTADALLVLVYGRLKAMARAKMGHAGAGSTLQPTALVHEAWLQVATPGELAWKSRAHFFGAAALAMRNILVDRARHHGRQKRGGAMDRRDLSDSIIAAPGDADPIDVIALDAALRDLERDHERPARVVALRYFAGLTHEEIAGLLELTTRTVERDWLFAKTWLRRALDG